MRTVAAAIKEDLSKVKDVLDIFVRRGGGQIGELTPQLELLKKISDTLGVLGLGELRQRVQQEVSDLSTLLRTAEPPSEDALVKVAGVLLSVEDSLDDQLVRLILPAAAKQAARRGSAESGDAEFRHVSEAVLRECIVNLARIKEAVSTAVQKPGDFSPQGLDNVPQLLRGITAGLLMLGKGRAVELMDAIGVQVRKLIEPGAPAPDAHAPGARGRCDRQHRVLHGDAAERAQRSLVHARQRRDLHQAHSLRSSLTRVPTSNASGGSKPPRRSSSIRQAIAMERHESRRHVPPTIR